MDERPPVQLDYQVPQPRRRWWRSRQTMGFLAGLVWGPVLYWLLDWQISQGSYFAWALFLFLSPYTAVPRYTGYYISAFEVFIIQAPLYGWLIGWMFSNEPRRKIGLPILLILHGLAATGLIWLFIRRIEQ